MTRVRLGDWTCPSGNNVVVYAEIHATDEAVLRMQWDTPPPLRPADEIYYRAVIRPAALALAAEYMERPMRRTLLLELQ